MCELTVYVSLLTLHSIFITSTVVTKYFASNIIIWITKESFKPIAVCYTNFDAVQDCYVKFEQSFHLRNLVCCSKGRRLIIIVCFDL